MKLRHLFEKANKTAVAAFGRMNPPTIGHKKLVDKIKSFDGDHYVFLSQTQKPKDNPLPFDVKLEFAKKFFPGVNVGHSNVRTPIHMMKMLEKLGYTDVIYVAGSDRVEQFKKLLNDYNDKEYNFNSIEVVSAGERDPDADGAEGMSASKMRAAAAAGDFESFAQGVPDPQLAEKMYDAVRTGMGVKDAVPTENIVEFDVKSSKGYEQLEDYAGREIYRSRKKFKEKYFIAQAVHPRTRAVVAKVSDENRKTAEQKLHAELDKMNTERKRVTGNATVDFNVEFAKQILSEPSETFYAKIIAGPKLVIAGSEMLEYPEIMQDEGFKRSAIRNRKDSEGSTRLPAIPLSARQAGEANVVANGRYVVGNQSTDKDGNLVFDLEFDSEVYDKNDRVRIRQPALTIGTNRNESFGENTDLSEQQLNEAFPLIVPALAAAVRMGAPVVSRLLSKEGAKQIAKGVAKNAGKAAVVTGKAVIKNPGKTAAAYGAYTVWDTVNSAIEFLEDIGLDTALIPTVAKVIVQYGIPAAAVLAALYGGKKLYDYIKDSNESEEQAEILSALEKQYGNKVQTESDVVLDKTSLRTYIRDMIVDKIEIEQDIEKLAKILKILVGKTVKARGTRYQVTSEDIAAAMGMAKHGRA